jgi:hypothetical protein
MKKMNTLHLSRHVCVQTKNAYYLRHVCLSARMCHLGSHLTSFHEIFYLRLSLKSVKKHEIWLQQGTNVGNFTWRPTTVYCWQRQKHSLQVKRYETVRISVEVYILHGQATILCCRYIADHFFIIISCFFTNSLSSQSKFRWEIVVIASTMSFNCVVEYHFKVTNCLYVLCICMYIKYFCFCALCWYLWYICFGEISLPVCVHLWMHHWKRLDNIHKINFDKPVTFNWFCLQKYKDSAMTQAVSHWPVTARPKFIPRLVCMRFVVIKVTMGQGFLRVFWFPLSVL